MGSTRVQDQRGIRQCGGRGCHAWLHNASQYLRGECIGRGQSANRSRECPIRSIGQTGHPHETLHLRHHHSSNGQHIGIERGDGRIR